MAEEEDISEFDDEITNKLDESICKGIKININQSPKEKLEAYREIFNNYQEFIQRGGANLQLENIDEKLIQRLKNQISELEEQIKQQISSITIDGSDNSNDSDNEMAEIKPKDAIIAIPIFTGDIIPYLQGLGYIYQYL